MPNFTLTWLFLLVAVLSLSFIQQNELEKKGKEILDKTSKHYKSSKTVKASFEVSTENKSEAGKKTIQEQGQLWLKGNKFKLQFEDQTIFCNGKYIWTYFAIEKEVTKEDYSENEDELGPTQIFSFYNKGFLYKYDGEYTQNKRKIYKVALTPTDKKKPYFSIILHVDAQNYEIQQMEARYKNGVRQNVIIQSQSHNTPFDNALFEWNPTDFPADFVDDLTD